MERLLRQKQNSSILRTYGIRPSPPLVVLSMEEANLTQRHSEGATHVLDFRAGSGTNQPNTFTPEESLKPFCHSEAKAKNPGVNVTSLDPSVATLLQDDENYPPPGFVLDLLRLEPVTRYAYANTRFGSRYPEFTLFIPSANPLSSKFQFWNFEIFVQNKVGQALLDRNF